MSRVFDALQKTGGSGLLPPTASPAEFVDALDKGFRVDAIPSVQAQLSPASRLVFHTDPSGPNAERYRLLRLRLNAVRAESEIKTLLITSPGPQEGKSNLTLNLAAAMAEKKKQSVLILEADLRRPSLVRELGLRLPSGLTQCTRSDVGLQSTIYRIEPFGFYLLPAGKPLDNPAELLNSDWFSGAAAKLADSFDWIIIDSPPAIPVVDAISLNRRADASIIVARAGRTQQSSIADTIQLLGQDHVLAIVLNAVEKFGRDYSGYYEYYGHSKDSHSRKRRQ